VPNTLKAIEDVAENRQLTFDQLDREIIEERKKALKEKGYNELLVLGKGENKVELLPSKNYRIVKTKFGERVVFPVKQGKAEYDLMASKKSPLLRGILSCLKSKQYKIKILKTGEGQQTRYDILV